MHFKLKPRSARLSPFGSTGGSYFTDADSPFKHACAVLDIPGGSPILLVMPDTAYAKSLLTGAFTMDNATPDETKADIAEISVLTAPQSAAPPPDTDVASPDSKVADAVDAAAPSPDMGVPQ